MLSRARAGHWLSRVPDLVESAFYATLSVMGVYVVVGGGFSPLVQRTVPVALVLGAVLVALFRPQRSSAGGSEAEPPAGRVRLVAGRLITGLAAVGGIVATLYLVVFQDDIVTRPGLPTTADTVMGVLGIACLLAIAWVRVGAGLALFAIAGIAYVLFGAQLPDPFGHIGFSVERLASYVWTSTEGVFGSLLGIMARVVMIFVILGALLEVSGAGKFFIDLAAGIGRRFRSGPAQAAVLSSGLMGTINGSAVANVAGTGHLTIPLMKRMRYKPEFAGAVESSASIGGQILPPVMGASAFLMSQTTGIPYAEIALAAVIPAVLFFAGIGVAAHLQAVKSGIGITPAERSQMPTLWQALRTGGVFLLPIAVLVWLLSMGRSPSYAGAAAIGVLLVLAVFRSRGRRILGLVWRTLVVGGRNSVPVWLAIAVVGVILGALQITGLGNRFSELIVSLAGGSLALTLLLTMLACLVLGIGLPTSATYLLLAVTVAPALIQLGVGVLEAHLFILYFGALSDLTPPVSVAPYVAAGIAGGRPVATSMKAFMLTVPGFVIPFAFALDGSLLGRGSPPEVLLAVAAAAVGTAALAASHVGYHLGPSQLWERVLLVAAGVMLIIPYPSVRLVGAAALLLSVARPGARRLLTLRRPLWRTTS